MLEYKEVGIIRLVSKVIHRGGGLTQYEMSTRKKCGSANTEYIHVDKSRHDTAQRGRDKRCVFDLQTKIALILAKNDDHSLHKYALFTH